MNIDKSEDRDVIVARLHTDMVGPREQDEELTSRPTDAYLTGILWPQRIHMTGEDDERVEGADSQDPENNDSGNSENISSFSIQKPSTAGLSFCVSSSKKPTVNVNISFARYHLEENKKNNTRIWKRKQILIQSLPVDISKRHTINLAEKDSHAENAHLSVHTIPTAKELHLVTLTLINMASAGETRDELEASTMFQTCIHIEAGKNSELVSRPSSHEGKDIKNLSPDVTSGMLLFRDVSEYAVGHVCSATWELKDGKSEAEYIETTWVPTSFIKSMNSEGHPLFKKLDKKIQDIHPLVAKDIAFCDKNILKKALGTLCDVYEEWIDLQYKDLSKIPKPLEKTAKQNLEGCKDVLNRMKESSSLILSDPNMLHAFRLANLAMHTQYSWDSEKSKKGDLKWRPFQLGFLLLSATSTAKRDHEGRKIMDLLWFPTGGGKTEAYLALVAFVSFFRRMSDNTKDYRGVTSIMRYTLRLLTTQQFARSAAMILACEAIRLGKIKKPDGPELKGDTPFSIGLWVGGEATPNTRENSFTLLNKGVGTSSPKQLAYCPCCTEKLKWSAENISAPTICTCKNEQCLIAGELPIWTVDEDIYERRPTLLIGTVDKFVQIVRKRETNMLFSIRDGHPPDLIIQDELHLISGQLGTLAGIYETAFDILFTTNKYKPKIIGSTATIQRASEQVRCLFDREACQFPPPALNHHDSGFAIQDQKSTGRRYVGITTAGRSGRFILQSVAASLLQSAYAAFDDNKKKDPYWSLVGYYNSLRELGGSLVLMQDDVGNTINFLAETREEKPRHVKQVEELTSRRTQEEILDMLESLSITADKEGSLDVILATNMVSVGVDIPRLGLMLVFGQPKAISEYIQSTSRVGRGSISGLVVTVLNNAKTRDRSHFENFASYHQTLYRDVEATSVTPFAPRARDKALHAALVAVVRHTVDNMLDEPNMDATAEESVEEIIKLMVERAKRIDPKEEGIEEELMRYIQTWKNRAPTCYWDDSEDEISLLQSSERAASRKALGKSSRTPTPTPNSMRNVEPGTPFRMASALSRDNQ